MSPQSWDETLTQRVVGEIRRLRADQKMSAQALSDRTTELGHTVTRSTIADLESGRRKYITVTEVFMLARALNTVPIMLLFPGPLDAPVESLPGLTESQLDAVMWFCGEGFIEDPPHADDLDAYTRNRRPLAVARILEELRIEKIRLEGDLQVALKNQDDDRVQMYTKMLSGVEDRIKSLKLANGG